MVRKLSIEDCKKVAIAQNGECLSSTYINSKDPMNWKCEEGHEFVNSVGRIKGGQWCPQCVGNTIENCNQFAINQNGKCLSHEYKTTKEPMRWKCEEGHEWENTWGHIKAGQWCRICSGHRIHTLKSCQEYIIQKGGKCLSTEYKNIETKMLWECEFGHQWDTKFTCILRGHWCPRCSQNYRLDLEHCEQVVKQRGGKCLSLDYINSKIPLRWECKFGHQWETQIGNIKQGSWCNECSTTRNTPYTIEDCHKIAEERKGKCLSYFYENSKKYLDWQCEEGHQWSSIFSSVLTGRWCPVCAGTVRHTLETCHKMAETQGGKCLSYFYENNHTIMSWSCKNNHTWDTRFHNICSGNWCPICATSNKTENEVRTVFEDIFKAPFPNTNPSFLKNPKTGRTLQLDGFNVELKLAFEYHGKQHYEFVKYYHHNDPMRLEDQQYRDQVTRELCIQEGITLIEIPYTIRPNKMRLFIVEQLTLLNLLPN